MKKNAAKYPVHAAKGRADKYTQLAAEASAAAAAADGSSSNASGQPAAQQRQ